MRADIEDVSSLIDENEGGGWASDQKGRSEGEIEVKGRFTISKTDWYTINPNFEENRCGIS